MNNAGIEKWVWVLIYGGLLLGSLGIFLRHLDPGTGWTLIAVGGLAAVFGAVLIYVRSRRPD